MLKMRPLILAAARLLCPQSLHAAATSYKITEVFSNAGGNVRFLEMFTDAVAPGDGDLDPMFFFSLWGYINGRTTPSTNFDPTGSVGPTARGGRPDDGLPARGARVASGRSEIYGAIGRKGAPFRVPSARRLAFSV